MKREPTQDYLWNRSGAIDPLVAKLEGTLRPLRHDAQKNVKLEPRGTHERISHRAAMRAAAAIGVAIVGAWLTAMLLNRSGFQQASPSWSLTALFGTPQIGSDRINQSGEVRIGQWIQTDSKSQAQLAVANIGRVTIDPDSRVRLVASREHEHRLELAKGEIEAFITAPPRLFLVDTPAATAVDLGCKYRLNVEEDGSGMLEVTLGWVSLERDGMVSVVPSGAACRIDDQRGPGTPCYLDASERFRAALQAFDFTNAGDEAIEALLAEARPRDGMTLWHLIPRVGDAERERIVDFMNRSWPLPDSVSRDQIIAGKVKALNDWAQSMYWSPPAGSMPSKF